MRDGYLVSCECGWWDGINDNITRKEEAFTVAQVHSNAHARGYRTFVYPLNRIATFEQGKQR